MVWLEDVKVLVVDDDKTSVDLAKLYLDRMWVDKSNITMSDDLLSCVEMAKKGLFDLILMDIKIWGAPRAGVAATELIRAKMNGDSPRIIAYSADVFATKEEGIREKFDWIIVKPVKLHTFRETILGVLEKKAK